jgi:hypothetical protein
MGLENGLRELSGDKNYRQQQAHSLRGQDGPGDRCNKEGEFMEEFFDKMQNLLVLGLRGGWNVSRGCGS